MVMNNICDRIMDCIADAEIKYNGHCAFKFLYLGKEELVSLTEHYLDETDYYFDVLHEKFVFDGLNVIGVNRDKFMEVS